MDKSFKITPISFESLKKTVDYAFQNRDKLISHKYIQEFKLDEKYIGDVYNYFILDISAGMETPPTTYITTSPYDIITKTAPQRGLVYRDGELLVDTDFTFLVSQRTGFMTAYVLDLLQWDLSSKKILFYGSGKISKCDVMYLKDRFGEVFSAMTYTNKSGQSSDFEKFAEEHGVKAEYSTTPDTQVYDIIVLHTSAENYLLSSKNKFKDNVFIASYVTEMYKELSPELYAQANILVTWEKDLELAHDLAEAIKEGHIKSEDVTQLQEILRGKKFTSNTDKKMTIFRTTGTPMQNYAILKALINN